MWNWLLDKSIVYAFDRTGFERHQREFREGDLDASIVDKVCVITGASGGIGFEVALALAHKKAKVFLLCRNRAKSEKIVAEIQQSTGNPHVYLVVVDMADLESVQGAVTALRPHKIDILVHNAGVLPTEYAVSPQGWENTVATNIIGHHLLTRALENNLHNSKIIMVSSGGMYPVTLKNGDLFIKKCPKKFDGVYQYALSKRAQVVLTELWAKRGNGILAHCMHPGWADTPGVQTSLPGFWNNMANRLRTPAQGADTIVWLSIADIPREHNGAFWFDRKKQPTHIFPWQSTSAESKQELWCRLEDIITPYM